MISGLVFHPSPVFYVIIGALAGTVIGWVIGFFDSNNRTSKKIEVAEERAATAVREAEQKIAATKAGTEVVNVLDDPGLLRLKNMDGQPALEMDGATLNVKAVSAEQRKRLIELLTAIRPWVDASQPIQPVSKPAAPMINSTPQPSPSIPRPAPASTPSSTQPLPAVKPPEEVNIRLLSIVAQIDSVLQKRLTDSPLANSGIRLSESAMGGVEVYVGNNKYPSVDDVPDPQIKSAIRAAIAEWEEKYTPGA